MVRKRNTERALVCSLIMLVLSYAMLLGTTFAWFTVSVSSGITPIRAGNLQVQLEYSLQPENGQPFTWIPVDNATELFGQGTQWEPGYTGIVYLRVTNTGSLALKYRYNIQVTDNVLGKTASGNDIDLRKYISLGVAKGITAPYAAAGEADARDVALKAVTASGTLRELSNGDAQGIVINSSAVWTEPLSLEAGAEPHIYAVVVTMPSTVGNAANSDGEHIPSLKLRIHLDATQLNSESDSFGSEYDENATYPTQTTAPTPEGQ